MLRWTFLLVISLFLFTGCGDLEPEMQDTRTVILNIDFHGKSSSRSSSSVSASELSQYNTHLILALPSWEDLSSNYNNFYSSFAQGLMNKADKKVSLEIPLNTQMKIFAFLFKENYSHYDLFTAKREAGYYGDSQSFTIGSQTDSLRLNIRLTKGSGTDTTGGTDTGGGTDYMAPTVTFSPANGATGVTISNNIAITFSEAVRNIDNTVLTDSNSGDANGVGSLITLRLNNTYGTNIAFYATIDTNKTVITIDPTNNLPHSQAVYVVIGATVEDSAGNPITAANATFTTVQETTGPTVSSVYPADNQNEVSITQNISVTFSKSMNTTSVTTNMSNTTCSGSFQLSSNNFSSCIQMSSSPSSSNSYRTFSVDPSNNLSNYTNYKIRVTTGVKDTGGNTLSSQYETLIGFTTSSDNSSNSSDNSSSSGSGVIVGVGYSGKIVRSTDNGSSWDNVTSVDSTALRGIAFGNNTFLGVGQSGKILRSTDNGLTFSAVTSVDSTALSGVAFGNNTFVAVGSSGKIIRSTDNGSSWDNVTSVDSTRLKEIAFGNNTFVGVGASGRIVRSTDNGSSFTAVTPVNSNINQYPYYHHYGVTFGNNTFVVVGASESGSDPTDPGSIVRSTDNGSTFSAVNPVDSNTLFGVTF